MSLRGFFPFTFTTEASIQEEDQAVRKSLYRPICITRSDEPKSGPDRVARGAVLLVISGEPRQALLSWLSGYVVEVPPLPTDALREAISYALEKHYRGRVQVLVLCGERKWNGLSALLVSTS